MQRTISRVAAIAIASCVVAIAPAAHDVAEAAAPLCASVNVSVTSAQGVDPVFYIDQDTSPVLDSEYSGWKITNSGAVTRPNLWVRLANFSSPGVLRVGVAPNEPNAYSLGNLEPAAQKMSYTYLTAPLASADIQNYAVQVWTGDPRLAGSTQLCESPARYLSAYDTIQAAANKVSGTLVGPNPPGFGGIVQLTVLGQGTGTLGSGTAEDPSVFWMSPAAISSWQANAYKLVKSVLYIDPDGSGPLLETSYTDQLRFNSFTGGDRDYHIVYTFTAIGVTTGSTATYPVQNIASGTQVKHTTLTAYGDPAFFPSITSAINATTLTKSTPSPTALPGNVGYTVTVHAGDFGVTTADNNGDGDTTDPGETSTNSGALDNIRDVMPAGATFVSGSATWQGVAVADPTNASGTLIFNGPFVLASNTNPTLTYTLDYATHGTKVNAAYAVVGTTHIDTTLVTTDDAPATATVIVRSNAAPAIGGTVSGTGNEDTTITGTVTATDADGDGVAWAVPVQPSNGTASINPTTGAWTFVPVTDWFGSTSFAVTADDGFGGVASQVVTITVSSVNDSPVIGGVLSGSGVEDAIGIAATATSTDIDGGLPLWSVSMQPANGTASIDASGIWSFVPNANWSGTDVFTITVSDGNGGTDSEPVSITLTGDNDAPVIGGDLSGSATEDNPVTGVASDTDIDGGPGVWTVVGAPSAHGVASIDPMTGAWTFTPDANWSGIDTFEIGVDDGYGGTDTAMVNVTVFAGNDAPMITGGLTGTGPEDGGPITATLIASDIEGDALLFALFSGPSNGLLVFDPATGDWSYTPNPDFFGTDDFTASVSDGNGGTAVAIVTVAVTPVNDPPIITGGLAGTTEQGGLPATGTATASDIDGGSLTFSLPDPAAHGSVIVAVDGGWSYIPDSSWIGSDTFVIQVSDGNGGVRTATLTVVTTAGPAVPATATVHVSGYLDLDGNGVRGASEPFAAANLTIVPDLGGVAVTHAGPSAQFDGVAAGAWTATATLGGLTATPVAFLVDGSGDVTVSVALREVSSATITVGWDDDGDGNPDRFIGAAVVHAFWSGTDGIVGTADDIQFDVITDASGSWTSASLPSGTWTLSYAPSGSTTTMTKVSAESVTANLVISRPPRVPTPSPPTFDPTGLLPTTGFSTDVILRFATLIVLLGAACVAVVPRCRRPRSS